MLLTQERSFHEYFYKGAPYEPHFQLPEQVGKNEHLRNVDLSGQAVETIRSFIFQIIDIAKKSDKKGFINVTNDVVGQLSKKTKQKLMKYIQGLKEQHTLNSEVQEHDIKKFVSTILEVKADASKNVSENSVMNRIYEKLKFYFS